MRRTEGDGVERRRRDAHEVRAHPLLPEIHHGGEHAGEILHGSGAAHVQDEAVGGERLGAPVAGGGGRSGEERIGGVGDHAQPRVRQPQAGSQIAPGRLGNADEVGGARARAEHEAVEDPVAAPRQDRVGEEQGHQVVDGDDDGHRRPEGNGRHGGVDGDAGDVEHPEAEAPGQDGKDELVGDEGARAPEGGRGERRHAEPLRQRGRSRAGAP